MKQIFHHLDSMSMICEMISVTSLGHFGGKQSQLLLLFDKIAQELRYADVKLVKR
jgi:hypothetical protein